MDGESFASGVAPELLTPSASPDSCPSCAAKEAPLAEEFIYALGKLEVRFPSVGIEREFQQRQARLPESLAPGSNRGSQIKTVLQANRHLVGRLCYVLLVGGVPAYIMVATGSHVREAILEGLENAGEIDRWCVAIGRRGPLAGPGTCGGVLAPILFCDQLYIFSLAEWEVSLEQQVESALKARKIDRKTFAGVAGDLFARVIQSTENVGATDAQRALNYLLMQHPGLFLAAAERSSKQILDRVETRPIQGLGTRRLIAVVVSFVDLTTAVPERLFTRVDVTEEWPFVADGPEGGRAQLGLSPFVENMLLGTAY